MLNQICNNTVSHRAVIYCPAVPTFPNAIADTRANSAGTIVTYSCEEGFNAEGEFSFTAECMDNEQWNISKSQGCQSKLKTPLKYFSYNLQNTNLHTNAVIVVIYILNLWNSIHPSLRKINILMFRQLNNLISLRRNRMRNSTGSRWRCTQHVLGRFLLLRRFHWVRL